MTPISLNNRYFKYIGLLIFICCQRDVKNDIPLISIDIHEDNQISLSEISENVTAINLQLTDESMISHLNFGYKVFLLDDYILFSHHGGISLFNRMGKFIRSIGRRGQGPGEISGFVMDITVDLIKEIIFVSTNNKVICFTFNNEFLYEAKFSETPEYLMWKDNSLNVIVHRIGDQKHSGNVTFLYNFEEEFILKNKTILRTNSNKDTGASPINKDYIVAQNDTCFFFRPDWDLPYNRDTLFLLIENRLIPTLAIELKNYDWVENKNKIFPQYIYQNSRFIIAHYLSFKNSESYFFCYDKTRKRDYNTINGFWDDLYTHSRIKLRPLNYNPDMFYYLHTDWDEMDDTEEPNPTLYIGYLKK